MKRFLRRAALIVVSCGVVALGGYETSKRRAGLENSLSSVIAAAGGEPSSLLGSSGLTSGDDRYRLSALSVFSNVALHVKDHYVDPERVNPKEMLVSALEEIERQIAEVLVEEDGDRVRVEVMGKRKIVVNDVQNLWEVNLKLREVFRFFEKHLPPQDDVRLIEYAAVNGALSTLDPHSILLKPEAFAEMKTSTKGEFGGLGIVISVREGKLTIISPIDGTPASRAGLQAGDVISRIGDVSTVSMPVDEAVRMLRGPKGSKVTIWVDRSGWTESRKFSITRERIKLESVESELLSSRVGYIKIKNFQQNTGKDLEDHLASLEQEAKGPLRGLIIDLRNNPGGLLEQATRVSDKFLSSGDIVTTVGYGNKLREPKRARWAGTETKLPLAVLVNRGSASASEIVAGALKNLDRATIIGETTFGKGSVQVLYDFSDSSALKLTIAQYLTPGDISIQNEGVEPDIALKPAWLDEKSVRMFYESDGHREASLDKHLDKAGRPKAQQSAPVFGFTYVVRDEEPEEEADDGGPARVDFPVELARDYLLAAGSSSRAESLVQGRKLLEARSETEEQALVKRLAELGIDWSASPGKERGGRRPKLEVTLGLVDPKAKGTVVAGDEVRLEATVVNVGAVPVYRLHGILESEHPAFEGREMLFGHLPPGATKSWTVHTRIAREEASRTDPIKLVLEAENVELAAEAQTTITTRYLPKPQFAFTYLLNDTERGDGDGILEVGEGVDLEVLVTNVGEGHAEAVALRLKSAAKEDLFLERGRTRVGPIGPGETKGGTLRFRVPERQSGRGKLPLELAVYDTASGEWLEAQFDLRAAPVAIARPGKLSGARRTKRSTTLLRGAGESEAVVGVVATGTPLEAESRFGGFVRVRHPSGARGFVRAQALEPVPRVKGGPAGPTGGVAGGIDLVPSVRPPQIVLRDDPGGRVIASGQLRLEGYVSARQLRDLYVLLNDDKVYFRRAEGTLRPAGGPKAQEAIDGWLAPNDAAIEAPFELDLRLKEGLNKVVVVARLDERVTTQRTLYVSRMSAPAVAERIDGHRAVE